MNLSASPFFIVWYPHSGCRWLNRGLLSSHPHIATSEFVLPFLTHSTDMLLGLDRTSQVHKARSLPELSAEFDLLRRSIQAGRLAGTREYMSGKLQFLADRLPGGAHGGPVSPGAPEPLAVDLPLLLDAVPGARILHLVRHPFDCFRSMKSRWEMDADPERIASSWLAINAAYRLFAAGTSRSLTVRYEDLRNDTRLELKRIASWLNVDANAEIPESQNYFGRNQSVDLSRLLTESEAARIWAIAGREGEHYGYTTDAARYVSKNALVNGQEE